MKLFKKYILFVLGLNLGVAVHAQDSITLVSQLPITGLPIHDIYGYTHPTTGVKYALLCASNSGLRVIDLSDLSNPSLVGSIQGGGVEPIDVKVWGNYAYVISESSSLLGKIIDLSDPTNPVKVGTFPAAHNITISDSGYMYLSAPGVRIMDLNIDPINPVQVYFDNSCEGHDISIIGNRLYDFPGNCGTRIYDVSQPDTLVLIGSLPAGGYQHSGWTTEDSNFLFVCDELAKPLENDITVWNISDLNNPMKVDSFSDPSAYVHNLYVKGNYAYVSYYRAGFRVFDVSDPVHMQLVDEYDTDTLLSGPGYGGNFGLFINWGIDTILASDENNGLFIFSFTNLKTDVENLHQKQNDFKLYPNPSNGMVNVDLNENLTDGKIQIYASSGALLKELPWSKNLVFSTKEWGTGMYYLTITTSNSVQSQPFYVVK